MKRTATAVWTGLALVSLAISQPRPAMQSPTTQKKGAPAKGAGSKATAAAASKPPPLPKPVGGSEWQLGVKLSEPAPLRIPGLRVSQLPSGLRLAIAESRGLPLISGVLLFRAGSQYEPVDRAGIAGIAAQLIRRGGIAGATGAAVDARLRRIGATIDPFANDQHAGFEFSFPSASSGEMIELLHAMAAAPALSAEAFEEIATRLRGTIAIRNLNGANVAARELWRAALVPSLPYGRVPEYENLERIQKEDAAAWVRRYYFPGNGMLALTGDFSAADMEARAGKAFAGWSNAQSPVPPPPAVPAPSSKGVLSIEFANRESAYFSLGHAMPIQEADRAALDVTFELAGGALQSWGQRTRQTRQFWVQRLGGQVDPAGNSAVKLQIAGSAAPGAVTEVIRDIFKQLDEFSRRELTPAMLEAARMRVVHRWMMPLERPSAFLRIVAARLLEGDSEDFAARYQAAVQSVSQADVARVYRAYMKPEAMTVSVAGTSNLYNRPLSELNLPVTAINPANTAPRLSQARTDPESLETGKEWLVRMQQALGGAAKLAAIRDFQMRSKGTAITPSGQTPLETLDRWVAEDTIRQDQRWPDKNLTAFYNGKIGWISNGITIAPLPSPVLHQMRGEAFRQLFRIALSDRVEGRIVAYQGSGVLFISDNQENNLRIHLDEETGLPRLLVYLDVGVNGAPIPMEQSLSDWRETDGIKMPWQVTVKSGGARIAEQTVQEIRMNSGLKLADVERKP